MGSDQIFKDVCEIHARLFDHRPALQSELNQFVQEFETKRGSREAGRLQTSLENCREMSEKLLPESHTQAQQHLPSLVEAARKAVSVCEELTEKEQNLDTENSWLAEKREERVKEWKAFMDEMCTRSGEVDARHDEELKRLHNYYKDLEEKLKIHV